MHGIIEADGLTRTFGDVTAVDHVTLTIPRGELFGLLGPNGSGKTTMNKLMTGQIRPTAGTVRVMGLDVAENPLDVRRKVGIVPEQETPPSFLTAEEYLHFVGKIRGLTDIEERADSWFNVLEFRDKKDVLCKDLSRGTRQKLMVAQAFLHEPHLAFIDEPLINLDPVMQRTLKDFLQEYVFNGGTVFFSTHILGIAEEICTSFAILSEGSILHHGTIDDLRADNRKLEGFFLERVKGLAHA
jgi:ABC-2 type transport system ATP-binding protein